jgi:hypothetical protein
MTPAPLPARLHEVIAEPLPVPGRGETALRHARLLQLGRESLPLARLAEAHFDAVAILAEANRAPCAGAVYGVWASEVPGHPMRVERGGSVLRLNGTRQFCSGAGIVQRALITAGDGLLLEIDATEANQSLTFDDSLWVTPAFAEMHTAALTCRDLELPLSSVVGDGGWYTSRTGFWHGACGPAACWAGGATGLLDYALRQKRNDPHTLAHLGGLYCDGWALESYLKVAGEQIDQNPSDAETACQRALTVRHLVEQAATDMLRRLGRAYGPHPLAFDAAISRRCLELDLYLRQSHAERDLESLGRRLLHQPGGSCL